MVLGGLLALLLLILLLVLFVPVRYDLHGKKKEDTAVRGKVHWLFHIVTFHIVYDENGMRQILKVFGVPVWKN